jgi:hypothetical protein
MKNSSDRKRNRTHDHPTCGAVSHPTATPRAPTVRETSFVPANTTVLSGHYIETWHVSLPYRVSNVTCYVVMSDKILLVLYYIRRLTLNSSLDITVAFFLGDEVTFVFIDSIKNTNYTKYENLQCFRWAPFALYEMLFKSYITFSLFETAKPRGNNHLRCTECLAMECWPPVIWLRCRSERNNWKLAE